MEVLVAPIEKRRREREELKREEREKQKKNFDGLYTRLVFPNEKYVWKSKNALPNENLVRGVAKLAMEAQKQKKKCHMASPPPSRLIKFRPSLRSKQHNLRKKPTHLHTHTHTC